jgi:hypothetical protein
VCDEQLAEVLAFVKADARRGGQTTCERGGARQAYRLRSPSSEHEIDFAILGGAARIGRAARGDTAAPLR